MRESYVMNLTIALIFSGKKEYQYRWRDYDGKTGGIYLRDCHYFLF